jgi:hypothetical protein
MKTADKVAPMRSFIPLAALALLCAACNDRTSDVVIQPEDDMTVDDMSTATDADMTNSVDMMDMSGIADMPDISSQDMNIEDAADDGAAPDLAADMPFEPGTLTATLDADEINVRWTVSGATSLVLLRRLNAPVAGAQDAEAQVLASGAQMALDHPTSELLPDTAASPRTYHYALYACSQPDSCVEAAPPVELKLTLREALRGGGYNLFWRHASASTCADRLELGVAATTATPDWWRSCVGEDPAVMCAGATARQLTNPAAANEMMAVRDFMDQNMIPFSRSLSSEYCRCFKTAEGFELGPAVELLQELTYYVHDEAARCDSSYALLDTPPAAGTNVGMVSHAGFTCPVLAELAWGEAAIFKPMPGDAPPLLVARVTAAGWALLP